MSFLDAKLSVTRDRIASWLAEYKSPCVLWSGGKDSTVLLHIIRGMGHNLPCVTWQEPFQRERLAYTQGLAADWDLTLYDFPPSEVMLNQGHGRIDVMQRFQLGNFAMWLARGTTPVRDEKDFICGVDWLSRPTGGMQFPWDSAFHGHKSSDVDPCSGAVPLGLDMLTGPTMPAMLYPLRAWDDQDIFSYAEVHHVSLDPARYGRVDGELALLSPKGNDKPGNPDYYLACTRCLDPEQDAVVWCPKHKCQVNNVSAAAPWINLQAPYCSWKSGKQNLVAA